MKLKVFTKRLLKFFRKHGVWSSSQIILVAIFVIPVKRGKVEVRRFVARLKRHGSVGKDRYLLMQRDEYNLLSGNWSETNKNPVVGWWDFHNSHEDYDKYLFRNLNTKNLIALDYGCGPGRMIERHHEDFKHIHGIDISQKNIEHAKRYLGNLGISNFKVWSNDGITIGQNNMYDVVYSVITLQHIASHSIRAAIFEQVFMALKPLGTFSFQMGFGKREDSVNYFEDNFEASGTNGICDVRVENPTQLENDLAKIGFINFDAVIGEPCRDLHEKWIWVQVQKPNA